MTAHAQRFESLTIETAPDASRPMLAASHEQFGFVPSPVSRAAHSPGLLKHLFAGFAAFDHTALTPLEREVVAMTVAFEQGCDYCMAMHSAMLANDPQNAEILSALRAGETLADPRLDALRRFVRALVQERGKLPTEHLSELEAAGFSKQQSLDAALGAGVYWLSTVTNLLTEAELDAPFATFRWRRP
jgi:uncharacterized peroxidase-related enzyme